MKRSGWESPEKIPTDALCKSLVETNYQAYNISNATNAIYSVGNRLFFRSFWIKFARTITTRYNISNTRKLALLSRAYDTIIEDRLRKSMNRWKHRTQWRQITHLIVRQDILSKIHEQIPELEEERKEERRDLWISFSNKIHLYEQNNRLIDASDELNNERSLANSFMFWKQQLEKKRARRQSRKSKFQALMKNYVAYCQRNLMQSIVNHQKREERWKRWTDMIQKVAVKEKLEDGHQRLMHQIMWNNLICDFLYKLHIDEITSQHYKFIEKRKWKYMSKGIKHKSMFKQLEKAKQQIDLARKYQHLCDKLRRKIAIQECVKAKEELDRETLEIQQNELVKRLFNTWKNKQISKTASKSFIQRSFKRSIRSYCENLAVNSAIKIQQFYRKESNRIDYQRATKRNYFTKWKRLYHSLALSSVSLPQASLIVPFVFDFSLQQFTPQFNFVNSLESIDFMHTLKETQREKRVNSIAAISAQQIPLIIPNFTIEFEPLLNAQSSKQSLIEMKYYSLKYVDQIHIPMDIDLERTIPVISEATQRVAISIDGLAPQEDPQINEELVAEIGERAIQTQQFTCKQLSEPIPIKASKLINLRQKAETGLLAPYDNDFYGIEFSINEIPLTDPSIIQPLANLTKIEYNINVDLVEEIADDIDFTQTIPVVARPVSKALSFIPFFTKAEDKKQEVDEDIPIEATEYIQLDIFQKEAEQILEPQKDYIMRLEKQDMLIYDRSVHESAAIMLDIESVFNEIFLPSTKPLEQMTPIDDNTENLVEIDEEGIEKNIMSIISPDNFLLNASPLESFVHYQITEDKQKDELKEYSLDLNLSFLDQVEAISRPLEEYSQCGQTAINTMNVEEEIKDEIKFEEILSVLPYLKLINNYQLPEHIEVNLEDSENVSYDVEFPDFQDLANYPIQKVKEDIESVETETAEVQRVIDSVLSEAEKTQEEGGESVTYSFDSDDLFSLLTKENKFDQLYNISPIQMPSVNPDQVLEPSFLSFEALSENIKQISQPLFSYEQKSPLFENISVDYQPEIDFSKLLSQEPEPLSILSPKEYPHEANEREATDVSSQFSISYPDFAENHLLYNVEYLLTQLSRYRLFKVEEYSYNISLSENLLRNIINQQQMELINNLTNITKVEIPFPELESQIITGEDYSLDPISSSLQQNSPLQHLLDITFKEPLPERDVKANEIGIENLLEPVLSDIFRKQKEDLLNNTIFHEGEDYEAILNDMLDEAFADSINFNLQQNISIVDEGLHRNKEAGAETDDDEEAKALLNKMFGTFINEFIQTKFEEQQPEEIIDNNFVKILDEAFDLSINFAIRKDADSVYDFIPLIIEESEKQEERELQVEEYFDREEISKELDDAFNESIKHAFIIQKAIHPEKSEEEEEEKQQEQPAEHVSEAEAKEEEEKKEEDEYKQEFDKIFQRFIQVYTENTIKKHFNVFQSLQPPESIPHKEIPIKEPQQQPKEQQYDLSLLSNEFTKQIQELATSIVQQRMLSIDSITSFLPEAPPSPTLFPVFSALFSDLISSQVIYNFQSTLFNLSTNLPRYKSKEKKERKPKQDTTQISVPKVEEEKITQPEKQQTSQELDELEKSLSKSIQDAVISSFLSQLNKEPYKEPEHEEKKEDKHKEEKEEEKQEEGKKPSFEFNELSESLEKGVSSLISEAIQRIAILDIPENIDKTTLEKVHEKQKRQAEQGITDNVYISRSDIIPIFDGIFEKSMHFPFTQLLTPFIAITEVTEKEAPTDISKQEEKEQEEQISLSIEDIQSLLDDAFKSSIENAMKLNEDFILIPFTTKEGQEEISESSSEEKSTEEKTQQKQVEEKKTTEENMFDPIFTQAIIQATKDSILQTFNQLFNLSPEEEETQEPTKQIQEIPEQPKQEEKKKDFFTTEFDNDFSKVIEDKSKEASFLNIEAISELFAPLAEAVPKQTDKQQKPTFDPQIAILPFISQTFSSVISTNSQLSFFSNLDSILSIVSRFKSKTKSASPSPKKKERAPKEKPEMEQIVIQKPIEDLVKETFEKTLEKFEFISLIELPKQASKPQQKPAKEEEINVENEFKNILDNAFELSIKQGIASQYQDLQTNFIINEPIKEETEEQEYEEEDDDETNQEEAQQLLQKIFGEIAQEIPDKLSFEEEKEKETKKKKHKKQKSKKEEEKIDVTEEFDDLLNDAFGRSFSFAIQEPDLFFIEQEKPEIAKELQVIGDIEFTDSEESKIEFQDDDEELQPEEFSVSEEYGKLLDNAFKDAFLSPISMENYTDGMRFSIFSEKAFEQEEKEIPKKQQKKDDYIQITFDKSFDREINEVSKEAISSTMNPLSNCFTESILFIEERNPQLKATAANRSVPVQKPKKETPKEDKQQTEKEGFDLSPLENSLDQLILDISQIYFPYFDPTKISQNQAKPRAKSQKQQSKQKMTEEEKPKIQFDPTIFFLPFMRKFIDDSVVSISNQSLIGTIYALDFETKKKGEESPHKKKSNRHKSHHKSKKEKDSNIETALTKSINSAIQSIAESALDNILNFRFFSDN